ncbi:ribbon-helix-helix protein, CopG family [Clostridium perfringens]|nr:ribbon-helix-helix protein, CopG family [Clostridium perfringens]
MAREKSVKVRLTDKEDLFIKQEAERLGVSRSELVRILIYKEMENKKND